MILEAERLVLDTWQVSDWTALRPIATELLFPAATTAKSGRRIDCRERLGGLFDTTHVRLISLPYGELAIDIEYGGKDFGARGA